MKPSQDQPKLSLDTYRVSPTVLSPAKIICTYNEDDWEAFVLEWAEGFVPQYAHLDRLGGPGDKGRDVVAYTGQPNTNCALDLYQCKHYDHPLAPAEIWVELGKLCINTFRKVYRVPRSYKFVAPQGVGTTLHDLLTHPDQLRATLIDKWDKHCLKKITKTEEIRLEGDFLAFVQAFDFSIVGYIPQNAILEQHRRTKHWFRRFKQDPPPRPPAGVPPPNVEAHELVYVKQLFGAYGEHLGKTMPHEGKLGSHPELRDHFNRSRADFYMADSLNRFYRDQFADGAFDNVKKQVYDGVIDTVNQLHANGYQRVLATTQQAVNVQLAQSDYGPYVEPGDRKGICHHLVNDEKIQWTKK